MTAVCQSCVHYAWSKLPFSLMTADKYRPSWLTSFSANNFWIKPSYSATADIEDISQQSPIEPCGYGLDVMSPDS